MPGPVENEGCPDSDSDGDGIVDRRDKCPEQNGPARLRGCRAADRDGDGVPDQRDKCRRRAEVWNGVRDSDGCPDKGKPLIHVAERNLRLVRNARLSKAGKLSPASRRAIAVLGAAIRQLGIGRMELHVVAEYGLSYGDSVQRARRRAEMVKAALVTRTKLKPGAIVIVPRGPDGTPRVEVHYR